MTRIRQGRSAYDTALDYLTSKDRTVREIENRLDEGNFSETEIYVRASDSRRAYCPESMLSKPKHPQIRT